MEHILDESLEHDILNKDLFHQWSNSFQKYIEPFFNISWCSNNLDYNFSEDHWIYFEKSIDSSFTP